MDKGSLQIQLERAQADRKNLGFPPKDFDKYARVDALCVALQAQIDIQWHALRVKNETKRFYSAARAYAQLNKKERDGIRNNDTSGRSAEGSIEPSQDEQFVPYVNDNQDSH